MRRIAGRGLLAGALLAGAMTVTAGGCATGCPAALLSGTLVVAGDELALLEDDSGTVRPIEWPTGFGVRSEDGRLVVTDLFGGVKAREGDHVQLPGGERGSDGPWGVCGDMDTLVR